MDKERSVLQGFGRRPVAKELVDKLVEIFFRSARVTSTGNFPADDNSPTCV
jgi:hypothetical protein